ncbi:uncharacterized protein BDZ83DRAFT_273948 [Colletotrichum acutatum]|uniref:Uncharacterized protein n=1 Tax=Glomerella acutata TaxID=27357 RepID=A0AAD8XJ90_GLOAC|nr:uncharacterized protein BDZ83DRAFT_273948 [Colletotrichum acutatum]KAK1725955.1 hypothetical protein BDZ83DRAFT_273948 [Colletotrichum acutatum]
MLSIRHGNFCRIQVGSRKSLEGGIGQGRGSGVNTSNPQGERTAVVNFVPLRKLW